MVEENVNVTKTQGEGKAKAFFQSNAFVYVSCAVFILLLFLRDACSVGINKYLFVVLTLLCAVLMPPKRLIQLFCCLFPLYVGLPGNYMTLILIARLLLDFKDKKVKASTFFIAIAISIFVLIQEFFAGSTSIVNLMFIPGLFLVILIFVYKDLPIKDMIIAFTIGVAAMGIIMLVSTLQTYEFADLLRDDRRLGAGAIAEIGAGAMLVSIDPNYYGLFAITAISMSVSAMSKKAFSGAEKICIIIAITACLAIAFIGQSRAFLLVLLVWYVAFIISLKRAKPIFLGVLGLGVVAVLAFAFIPDVMDSLLGRFLNDDILTLNNRTTGIQTYFENMIESPFAILVGFNFFECEIHCMPLQYFFGGGIGLSALILGFVVSLMERGKKQKTKGISRWLPVVAAIAMSLSVPIASMLNFMFPIIVAALYSKYYK